MTRQYRPNQCPNCRFRKESACMNAYDYTLAGDSTRTLQQGWSPFSGNTDRKCNRSQLKEIVVDDSMEAKKE